MGGPLRRGDAVRSHDAPSSAAARAAPRPRVSPGSLHARRPARRSTSLSATCAEGCTRRCHRLRRESAGTGVREPDPVGPALTRSRSCRLEDDASGYRRPCPGASDPRDPPENRVRDERSARGRRPAHAKPSGIRSLHRCCTGGGASEGYAGGVHQALGRRRALQPGAGARARHRFPAAVQPIGVEHQWSTHGNTRIQGRGAQGRPVARAGGFGRHGLPRWRRPPARCSRAHHVRARRAPRHR